MSANVAIKSPLPIITKYIRRIRPYVSVLVFLLFAGAYGFLVLQINTLSNPVVDESAVTAGAQASPAPRIDAEAIKQLQSLKDNSVNVQTLFQPVRGNPFQE